MGGNSRLLPEVTLYPPVPTESGPIFRAPSLFP